MANPRTTTHETAHKSQSVIGSIALALVIVGAINWGLVGLMNLDLVSTLFGGGSTLTRIIYVLVGAAGIYALTLYPRVARSPSTRADTERRFGPDYGPGHPEFVERRRTPQPVH
jgi:hypothetical protein